MTPTLGRAAMNLEDEIRETAEVDPRALWHYANALYAQQTGDVERSLVEFQQAARYDSKSSSIHDRLAYHYYVEGMDYKSVEELQKSIELAPNNVDTRLLLANLFASQGEFGKAQKEYQKILEISPKNLSARYYLAGVIANQNHIEEALQKYQEILLDNPNEAAVYYNMGLIYTRANQVGKAEETFKKAISLDPSMESAYTSLGLVYELNQNPKDAIETYQALVKVNPENERAFLALGELYYNEKDDEKALEAFQTIRHPQTGRPFGLRLHRLELFQVEKVRPGHRGIPEIVGQAARQCPGALPFGGHLWGTAGLPQGRGTAFGRPQGR